ncbi:unnamed protein product [Lactuca virosa]|uniref:Uncharacterized protein n=1 Tax=Lactuca virosa TaxID=75947 RepID=A0AAU9NHI4_9ASTR|nr:unnamed protein product [Lactuca virosa]
MDSLKKKVVEIDMVAEVLGMDNLLLTERTDAVMKLQEIEVASILDLKQKSRMNASGSSIPILRNRCQLDPALEVTSSCA